MAGHFSSLLAAAPPDAGRIPVTVLTGFLGSGKTTLLNRMLRQVDLRGLAVIVNEFGQIGIDQDLIAHASEDTILLSNGCLCCAMRGDLADALHRLGQQQSAEGTRPQRVLIETSGLADPGPILRTLLGDPAVRGRFFLAGVACTVDAVLGMGTLDRYPESVRQVAVAEHLFLTKTDLPDGVPAAALLERLHGLNAGARLHTEHQAQPMALRQLVQATPERGAAAEIPFFYRPWAAPLPEAAPQHRDGISSFVLTRDVPLPREAFLAWLDMVIAMRGEDLLRVKGIVQLAEQPDQPLVIHGVQHLFQPPEYLPGWPGPDRRTRIVFITRGVDAQATDQTLDVLVRRHSRRSRASPPSPTL